MMILTKKKLLILIQEQAEENENNLKVIKSIRSLITKIRKLIKVITNNHVLHEHFIKLASNHKSKQLILDFHVRWNTTFLMLKRFVEFKSQIDEITHKAEKIIGLQVLRLKVSKSLKLNMMNGK